MKEKILLHTCCGPCVIAILEELKAEFDPAVFYYNPNIHPEGEYTRRRDVVKQICEQIDVKFIEAQYESDKWFEWAQEFKNEPEGGNRCSKCFEMRLEKTAKYAKSNNYPYFASTLTSGRNKKAGVINPIGRELGKKYEIIFLEEDWKKKGRQQKAQNLCKISQIYRQNYCGCTYSLRIHLG